MTLPLLVFRTKAFERSMVVLETSFCSLPIHSPGWWVMRGAPGGWRLLHVAEWFHSGLARPWGGGRTYSGVRGFSSGEGRARTEEGPMMDLQYFQLRAQVFKAYRQALRLTRNAPADAKGAIHPPAPFFFEERYSSNPHPHPIW